MLHSSITYPQLPEEAAAAHLDLLGGVVEGRIVPSVERDGEWLYDPEQLEHDESERAIASFTYEMFNLVDEGLVTLDDDDRPAVTEVGGAWYDAMRADLEVIMAIDEDRVYLVQKRDQDGYLHAYDQTETDEFDATEGLDLTHLRDDGLVVWGGDMVPWITKLGGEFLDAYRPELFTAAEVAA